MNQKELIKNLESTFNGKTISNLKNTNEELYEIVSDFSKKENKTIKNFVEDLGFKYSRKSLGELFIEDALYLSELYKDRVVTNLSDKDSKLYYKILNHSKLANMDIKQYLTFIGFVYNVQKEEMTEKDLIKELKKAYPDMNITKLSMKNQLLYNKLYKFTQKENTTITDFAVKNGFTIDLEDNYKNNRRKNKTTKNSKKVKNNTTNNKTKKEEAKVPEIKKRRGRPRKEENLKNK